MSGSADVEMERRKRKLYAGATLCPFSHIVHRVQDARMNLRGLIIFRIME